jgi:hypothetical protein
MASWFTSVSFTEEEVENGILISMDIWNFPVGRQDSLSIERIVNAKFETRTSTIEKMMGELFRTHRAALLLKVKAERSVK